MELAFSLGSNVGDRLHYLREAKQRVLEWEDTAWTAQSPVYETEPVGVKEQYRDQAYLNSVLVIETEATAELWLHRLQQIEKQLGRSRSDDRYAPRTLDIDILYAGEAMIDSGGLQVPHPRWTQRRFVVQPLVDVRPDKVIPGTGIPVHQVLEELAEDKAVRLFAEEW